jgi:hypothetical protein
MSKLPGIVEHARLKTMLTYREMNSIGAAERSELGLLPAGVALHLINSWRNTGYSKQIGQLLGRKIAYAYCVSFA